MYYCTSAFLLFSFDLVDGLQAKGAKRQYMEVARSLKLYGYLVFRPAICDYPEPHTRATLALGHS